MGSSCRLNPTSRSTVLGLLAVIGLALPAAAAESSGEDPPESLALLASAIDAPSVGREVALAGPLDLGHHGELVPADGTRVHHLLAGVEPVGALVAGSATFTVGEGEEVEVTVVSAGELAVRPGGDSYWSLGTWPWYPQPDLNGELATLEITVRVPAPFTPVASGAEVSRREVDGVNELVTRIDRSMQFPVVAAGKYHVYEETRDGITCRVAA